MCNSTGPSDAGTPDGLPGSAALRVVAGLLALIGYQLLAHWAATRAATPAAVAMVALGPLALVALWTVVRRSMLGGLALAAALAVVVALADQLPAATRVLPLLPQLAVCLGLAWMFGGTLRPGREPLVTRMAHIVHGTLPPQIVTYTRNVTLAWTLFMLAMSVASVVLFLFAPVSFWSLFANLLLLPLIALMFLAEYLYRSLRYRWFTHGTIAQSLGAFRRLRAAASGDSRAR